MSDFICECENCKREIDVTSDGVKSKFLDDDDDGDGLNLWLVYWECPYCDKKDNYNEIWG